MRKTKVFTGVSIVLAVVLFAVTAVLATDNRHLLTMFYLQSTAEVTFGGQPATFGGQPATW